MMDPQPPVWLTVKQAAARAQVGVATIYHEVRAGRLKAARIGGRRELRFRDAYIDTWLEASAMPTTVEATADRSRELTR
ncbi:MAG TPA: helix-turn-helix domain-containing protein [Gemmatimonadaceae bacterium]|nr:helix-turn-helix domain-containing protein [Gemmatimonadaceae bacterium]